MSAVDRAMTRGPRLMGLCGQSELTHTCGSIEVRVAQFTLTLRRVRRREGGKRSPMGGKLD